MSTGLTAAVCCLLASLAACTSLDLPPALDADEDGGYGAVEATEAGADSNDSVGDDTDDDQSAPPSPPSVRVDSGLIRRDAGKQTPDSDAGTPGKPAPNVDAGTPDAASSSTPDAGKQTPSPTPDAGTAPPAVTPPVVQDAGVSPPVTPDPGPTQPPVTVTSVVPGSAIKAQCSSYVLANGSMCGGYFCGVTQAQLAAEMPADNLCGSNAAASTCNNTLFKTVANCARDVRSANAVATNAEMRPKIQECVFKDSELQAKTPLACLSCYLDAAECLNDSCLVECLTGDSKGCDTCRVKNGCHTKALLCAKLPNPF